MVDRSSGPEIIGSAEPKEGESRNEWKRRRIIECLRYVRRFFLEHGHSDIPKGIAIIEGQDVHDVWMSLRNISPDDKIPNETRIRLERLAALGVNTSKPSAAEKRKARQVRENLAPPEQKRHEPYLQAIASFAERKGHTNIPPHRVSNVGGIKYGAMANAWRREHAGGTLSPWLTKELEAIPGWTWKIVEKPPQQKGKAVLPPDTTQMRRAGLRQFLPDED